MPMVITTLQFTKAHNLQYQSPKAPNFRSPPPPKKKK